MKNLYTAFALLLTTLWSSAQISQGLGVNYGPNEIYYQSSISEGLFNVPQWNKKSFADANGDGIKDVIVATGNGIYVYISNGEGEFTSVGVPYGNYNFSNFNTSVSGDFNNDGKLDFVWYNEAENDLIISYWTGNNGNNLPQYSNPARLNIAGFANFDGNGTYYGIYAVNAADIDGDGDVDILAFGPNGVQRPHMILNDGNGGFTRYDLHSDPTYLNCNQVADMNNDGKPEVLVGDNGGISIYTSESVDQSSPVPTFNKSVLISSADANNFDFNSSQFEVVDFNGDGKKDIILNCQYFNGSNWASKTRIFINTSSSLEPGNYTFTYTDLVSNSEDYSEKMGCFGAQYEDVNYDGVLDIIGIRGGEGDNALHKVSVALLKINEDNTVSVNESTLIDNGMLSRTAGQMSMNLALEDFDGDHKRDYLFAYRSSPAIFSYRTKFPQFRQIEMDPFSMNNKVFVGGSNTDNITLTVTSSSSGTFTVVPDGATVDGNGTATMTLTGTVAQVNNSLANFTYTPAVPGIHYLTVSVTNTDDEANYTNTLSVFIGRTRYYPKAGETLENLSHWSLSPSGGGLAPSDFGNDKEFVLMNSADNKYFLVDGDWTVEGKLTIPEGVTMNAGPFKMDVKGVLENNGTIYSPGTVYISGTTPQSVAGNNTFNNLVMQNPTYANLYGNTRIEGDLLLDQGTIYIGSATVQLWGTVHRNEGSLDLTSATLEMDGTTQQQLPSAAFNGYIGTLDIRNSNGVTLDAPLAVNQLKLTSGNLQLGDNDLTVTGGIQGGTATSYVQASGKGKLYLTIPNGVSANFPVGNGSYNPVAITNNSGADDNFSVNVLDEVYTNGSDGETTQGPKVKRTWNISKQNPNDGSGLDFVFNWNSEDANEMTVPNLYHFHDGEWEKLSGTFSADGNSLTYTGYTGSFSPFAVAEAMSTLPVRWVRFTAGAKKNQIQLDWQTATEQNANYFVVEHSVNGSRWETLGTVAASGSGSGKAYQFIHQNPVAGLHYYRLQLKDRDGKASYSDIATASIGEIVNKLSVFPNPVQNGILTVTVDKAGPVNVYNSSGALVLRKQLSAGTQAISLSNLAKGVYTITEPGGRKASVIVQ